MNLGDCDNCIYDCADRGQPCENFKRREEVNYMPYILEEKRPHCDKVVEEMIKQGIKADGDLNYILYKYCKYHVKASYNEYKNFIGELRETAKWIWWKLLVPYEKVKEEENGDV